MSEQEFQNSQQLIDEMVSYVARNGLTGAELTFALLSLLVSAMRASGEFESGLNDDDGVCVIHAKLYP